MKQHLLTDFGQGQPARSRVPAGWRATALLLLSLWLGLSHKAAAQVNTYTFSARQATFTPLTGATAVPLILADTYLSPSIPLGFTFVMDGAPYTSVKASSDGYLTFGTATGSSLINDPAATAAANRPLVAPLWDDLDGRPTGATASGSYLVEGTAPNRTFTFEWLNWEWNYNATGPVISFQARLYEGTNKIEFFYRADAAPVNSGSASIGLVGTGTGAGSYLTLDNTTATPAASSTTATTTLNTKPATGQVYTFLPAPPAACPAPRNLTATNLTNTTADLTWTVAGGGGTFRIEYGPQGFTPGQGTTVTSTTPTLALTGLTASTQYQFYVTQLCGGTNGNSTVGGPASFTTRPAPPANDACSAAPTLVPAAINAACTAATSGTLDGATATTGLATPVGTADDDVWYKFVATSTAHTVTLTGTGDYVQELLSGTCAGLTSVAYSDPNVKTYFGLTAGTTYYVRVYSYSATIPSTAAAAFTICVTTPTPPPANDDPCGAVVIPVAAGCTSPTQGSNVSATTTTPSGYTNPGCAIAASPIDVWFKFTTAASGSTSTGATIVTTGNAAGQVRVFSAASCTGPFTQVACKTSGAANTTAGSLDVSGLTPSTTYYVFVSGYGSGDVTGAFTLCVTPLPSCPTPTALAATNLTSTTADLSWTVAGGGGTFRIEYGPQGFTPGQGTTVTSTTPSITLTGLTLSTQYQFYVTQVCGGAAGNSPTVGPVSFTTRAVAPANDACASAVTLTPAAISAACTAATSGTLDGATATTGLATPVGTADDDVWYKFVATSTAHTVTLTGTGDYVQELLSGTCAGLTSVAYSDPNVKTYFGLTAGTTYYVRVYSYSATIPSTAAAAFTICVTTPTPPPANDDPCGAVVIPVAAGCTSPTQGSNVSATTTTPSGYTNPGCGIATAPIDVWFKFTTAASGPGSTGVSIITTGTAAGQLRVFSAASCTGPFTQVACKAGTAVNTNAGNLDVSGLTANTTYYVFVSGYSSSDATGAFTLCVTPPPTCATPGSLAVTNVTGTSVTLGWSVSSGTGPFTVNYGPVGFTPGTQGTTTTVTGTSLNVTGLTPGTQYQFYVTQNCGGAAGNSVRVGPVSFSTAALPPTNDECATATTLPVQSGLTCQNQLTGTNVGATGSTGIPAPGCSSYSGGDVWYVVTVPAGGTLTLETDQDSGSNLDDTGLAVYSGTCGALTVVDCNDDGGNGFFSLLTLTGRTPGERLYVRVFEYGNNEFGTFKICARAPSNCPAPSALTATNITTTTATLSWGTSAPTPSGTFDIEYGRQGFILGQGTVVTGLTATTYTLTGLSLDTDYCFYVRQNCGTTSGSSAYTGPECFRTLLPPATNDDPCTALTLPANGTAVTSTTLGATTTAPNGYVNPGCSTSNNPKDVWFRMTTPNGTGATTGTFTLTGSAAGQVRVFTAAACAGPFTQVACRASTGSNLPVGSFTVPGMLPNTTYYLMVAGYGSNDARGTFTIASSFVTATRNELPGGEVSVYPNPSNTGQVTLQLRGAAGVSTATAVLLNSLGQSVRRQVLPVVGGAAEVPLAVQGLAHGVYTLRLQVGDYTVTRKIVLE